MSKSNAAEQRAYRQKLKDTGYYTMLVTVDPIVVAAIKRIRDLQGGNNSSLIRAAILTHCALLEIKLPLPPEHEMDWYEYEP